MLNFIIVRSLWIYVLDIIVLSDPCRFLVTNSFSSCYVVLVRAFSQRRCVDYLRILVEIAFLILLVVYFVYLDDVKMVIIILIWHHFLAGRLLMLGAEFVISLNLVQICFLVFMFSSRARSGQLSRVLVDSAVVWLHWHVRRAHFLTKLFDLKLDSLNYNLYVLVESTKTRKIINLARQIIII